jgi:hypothetical protein
VVVLLGVPGVDLRLPDCVYGRSVLQVLERAWRPGCGDQTSSAWSRQSRPCRAGVINSQVRVLRSFSNATVAPQTCVIEGTVAALELLLGAPAGRAGAAADRAGRDGLNLLQLAAQYGRLAQLKCLTTALRARGGDDPLRRLVGQTYQPPAIGRTRRAGAACQAAEAGQAALHLAARQVPRPARPCRLPKKIPNLDP